MLGPLEVVADGRVLAMPTGNQRTLLVLLIVNANRVLTPDRIADEVWGASLPGSGIKALAFHVSRLRDALSPGRRPGDAGGGLETEAGGYILRVAPDAIDAIRFERLVREGHGLLRTDPSGARATLIEALGLWRGDPLLDVAFAEFAQAEIRRLEELRLGALEDRLEAELALGEHLVAIGELESLLDANPLRERLRGLLMLGLYRSGRQAEALRIAGTGRRLLSEELGIDPSPELVQLEAQMLAQDPVLDLPRPAPASRPPRNPYKGLRSFGEADSADFFGREALVGRLLARLEEVVHGGHLLVVVGPSGSGKSSVVRAGLLPALRTGALEGSARWQIATMVPGTAPFRELAAGLVSSGCRVDADAVEAAERSGDFGGLLACALAGGQSRLLLVIDQAEELFVRVDEEPRGRFLGGLVAALAAPGGPLIVVATLRADFLHVPLALPDVGELVRRGAELVTPLTRSELERAIVRPAEAVGVEVEPGLAVEMINDVEHRPGALPLLQYALTDLFDSGDGRRLTREDYAAIGGATAALGRRADEAWRSLGPDGKEATQQIFLRLVALSDGGVVTTRRVPRAELESLAGDPGVVWTALDDLGRRGLLAFDRDPLAGAPTVEIAHEALLVHWPRLAGWIEDLREDLWTRRRLAEAADEWQAAGRSQGFLSLGAKLDRFEAWARGTRLRLTDTEHAYLKAGVDERERLARLEAERVARERRLERRASVGRRLVAAVLVAGLVLAGGLSAALYGQQQTAIEGQAIATARQLAAGSVASLGKNRQLSVLLALEAADATATRGYVVEDAYDALHWALQEAQVPYPTGSLPIGVRTAPDGPRGVFLVAPEALMRLGTGYVQRSLTPDECRTYLHADSCPPVNAPGDGVSLGVRTAAGVVPAASLAAATLTGTHVRVLSELPADISSLAVPFERDSGVTVDWDPAIGGDLEAQIAARDLPDVAIVSRPSYVASAARDGWLVDLAGRVDTTAMGTDAGPYVMGLGLAKGPGSSGQTGRYGVPLAASVDDLLWYPAQAFAAAGYRPPTTAGELADLVSRLRADGRVPWCLGTQAGDRSGDAAAAWVEDLLLDTGGTSAYDRWVSGKTPFDSSEVRGAFWAFGQYVAAPGDVLNGLGSIDLIPEQMAAWPMLLPDGPECWLYRGASTDRAAFPAALAAVAEAVPFPGGSANPQPVLGRLYTVVILHDRPEVRRLVESLVGAPFASAMVSAMGPEGIFPIRSAVLPADAIAAAQTTQLRAGLQSGTFRVRAVDLFPGSVAAAFRQGVCDYLKPEAPGTVSDFSRLDVVVYEVDQAWAAARATASP